MSHEVPWKKHLLQTTGDPRIKDVEEEMYKNGLLHDSYISSGLGPGNSKSLCIRVRIRALLLRISSQTSTSANLQYKGVLDGGTSFGN